MGGGTDAKLNDSWNHDHVYLICPDLGVNWIQNECHVRKIHGCQLLSYRGCFVFWNIKRDFCRFHLILFGSKVDFSWFKKNRATLRLVILFECVSLYVEEGYMLYQMFPHLSFHHPHCHHNNDKHGCWLLNLVYDWNGSHWIIFFCLNDFLNPPPHSHYPLVFCLCICFISVWESRFFSL